VEPQKFDGGWDGVCFDDWKFGFQLIILYICSFFSVKQPLFLKEVLFAMEKVVEKQ